MKGIINWQELHKLVFPMPQAPIDGKNQWLSSEFADMYHKMATLEKRMTLNQINCLDVRPTDTLLDSGCGPGRLSVPFAKRAGSVTALDFNPFCLEYVKKYAAQEGVTNITTLQKDWTQTSPEEIGKFDIVICSRSAGLQDLEKLSSFSKRIAAIVSWGDGPNIPQILAELFRDTCAGAERPPRRNPDRRLGFNMMFNTVYDMGYAPNVQYVEDGFTAEFKSHDEAYAYLRTLGKVDDDKLNVFASNLAPYLTSNADGSVTFMRKTQSVVMWWDINHRN